MPPIGVPVPLPDQELWSVWLDPARLSWPGVIITCRDYPALISVEAGIPVNFLASKAFADRLANLLNEASKLSNDLQAISEEPAADSSVANGLLPETAE